MSAAPENSSLQQFNAPTAQATGEKFLIFVVGEEFYAVASKAVTEVGASFGITKLPNAPEWLLGISNLRGEIVPVINSPFVLQSRNIAAAPKIKFIVLRSAFFEFGAALAATRISEIRTFASDAIQVNRDEKTPHISGTAAYQSQILNLIDTEKLFSTLAV